MIKLDLNKQQVLNADPKAIQQINFIPNLDRVRNLPAIEDGTEVVLRLSSNMIGDSDVKINFPHELLLTNRQVSNLRKAFADKSSTDIKLSKIQISKMIQPGRYQIMKRKTLLK